MANGRSQRQDPLLDSVEEHARLFAAEHPELEPHEVHGLMEEAVDRGLVKVSTVVDSASLTSTQEAADRVLDSLRRRCLPRWEVSD